MPRGRPSLDFAFLAVASSALPATDEVIQSISVVAMAGFPKSHAFSVVKHKDVDAERYQREQTSVQLCQREG